MIQRTCQACGTAFSMQFEGDLPYCIDCSEAPLPTTAELYGQIPMLPTIYAVPTLGAPAIVTLPLDLVVRR